MNQPQQPTGNDQARNAQSSGPPQPTGNLSISEAARLLAERRSALRQQPAPTAPEEPAGSAPPETDEVEDEAQVGEQPDDQDVESELQPDGEEQAEETAEFGDDAILELDGEEVSLAEIKKWREGAMRQDDYQRKTQALAQKAQAMSAMEERLNAFSHAINRDFQMRMDAAQRALKPFAELDWAKLAETNPQQYNAQKVRFEQARAAAAGIQQQWASFVNEYEQVSQQTLAERARAALPEIKSRIKGWDDTMYSDRFDFAAKTYGADKNVLAKVVDPWFWEMANDAYLYRNGKKLAGEKVKRVLPRAVKTGAPTQRSAPQAQAKALEKNLRSMPQSTRLSDRESAALQLMQARRANRGAPRR